MLQARTFFRCLALTIASACAPSAAADAPPDPFVDQDACPIECCTHQYWTTRVAVDLFDKPTGRKIGKVKAGVKMYGLTCQTISHPIRVVAKQDYPDSSIAKDDVFYILHYLGERYWTVWHAGQVESTMLWGNEFEDSSGDWTKDQSVLWVQIMLSDGRKAWSVSDRNFDNQGACE